MTDPMAVEDWRFFGSCADGEFLDLDGVNVWAYRWTSLGRRALVRDPHHGDIKRFDVYDFIHGDKVVRIAAGEFSNGIFGFYRPVAVP